jgi:hypothetical protein
MAALEARHGKLVGEMKEGEGGEGCRGGAARAMGGGHGLGLPALFVSCWLCVREGRQQEEGERRGKRKGRKRRKKEKKWKISQT